MKLLTIAIDGPAGSGKSSVAKKIAEILNITYLDTGAMYRMVTLNIINKKIDLNDIYLISEILNEIDIKFQNKLIFLNGKDVTLDIRSQEVTNKVSDVAAMKIVREKMVLLQREIAKGQSIIMDGRDIGTHVLVNANYKYYLTASVEERAKRRLLDFKTQNIEVSLDKLIADINNRDKADMDREISPLIQAKDAKLIDTSNMTFSEVVGRIIDEIGD